MSTPFLPALGQLLARLHIAPMQERYRTLANENEAAALLHHALPLIEESLWADGMAADTLTLYQQCFRELEALQPDEAQHLFTVVIPVADRPQHLASCLASLLKLCDAFHYGGRDGNHYGKVSVLVADDSASEENQQRHRELAAEYTDRGLTTRHYGLVEQGAELASLSEVEKSQLTAVVGNFHGSPPGHKGASLMRNIAYLALNAADNNDGKRLFYFIDSDQEFRVPLPDGRIDTPINFLYHLDRIFRESDTTILTGKVVGDPPVSPAVMAGNFIEDVSAFLAAIGDESAEGACRFHGHGNRSDDAAYHDMADLFGFDNSARRFDYECTLSGPHDHAACLADFAGRINRFFDGEHPTRSTAYLHEAVLAGIKAARTIYTGNYIFRPEALRYFIPFAPLKLRMAGPVLGRIIRAEEGGRFVSANLPMLHKRTVEELGQSEFRPGIKRAAERVDLSGEFERQFYGDVMLFTMERLAAAGYPATTLTAQTIRARLEEVEGEMRQRYQEKRALIGTRLERLKTIFDDRNAWWQRQETLQPARAAIARFIANIEHNFGEGSRGYQLILDESHREGRLAALQGALLGYSDDRTAWQATLSRLHGEQRP